MQSNINIEKKKQIHNKSQSQLKTTYPFIKGIPPSSNWSNHFTSFVFPGGKYLLYISNSFIIVVDLIKKNFNQILSSYKILPKEKPNIILSLNNEKFLSVLNSGEILSFFLNNEGYFVEDLNTNKFSKVCQNTKCGIYDKKQNILVLSNENIITNYYLECEVDYNLYKIYEIDNINKKEYFITDMILIKIESDNYLAVCNNIGNIIIYKYDIIKYEQILLINSYKKENIYNIIFDRSQNLLCSINRSGTLNIYQLTKTIDNKLESYNLLRLTNQFNDQTISEFYLYFSISFIKDDDSTNILVTSNNGRIFIFNQNYTDFKEVAENPHKNSIYSILMNKDLNQIIFFSSDYKISLFNIINKKNESNVSINFATCINTIPSKVKILKQYFNKIYFLYQIQHQLYISSYDIKKEKNSLDTLQNKVKIKLDNKNNNNDIYPEIISSNYILSLCKLIDEERILLVNKNNEIFLYDIENEEIERKLLFLKNEEIIIDILYENNILYILYKSGNIIIYSYNTKKIEKYKISNFIEKGNLLNIQNDIIIITIKEFKSDLIQFYLMKNYICIKLKGIIIPNNFYSYQLLLPNYNLFYFYAFEEELKVFNMDMTNQLGLLKDIDIKEMKYETYLSVIDKLKNSLNNLNEKNYEFNSIFQRTDVNKNNLKITNIVINEKYNMICSFSDGSIMYYILDIRETEQNNYVINKIIYKYLIKVNFLSINDALFINNIDNIKENNYYFVTTSAEQSLKITEPSNCNILNINFKPNESNLISNQNINNIIINKSFTNLFSNLFFTQSLKEAKKFSENFTLPENINSDTSIEVLIYSYFQEEEKNLASIKNIIEFANNKIKVKKQNTQYIEDICEFFSGQDKTNNKLIFEIEKDNYKVIDILIEFYCYVESLLFVKYKNLGLEVFINCLEKIKKSVYVKQLFQATKIEKIIQYYKDNFNINL